MEKREGYMQGGQQRLTRRTRLTHRWTAMENERSSFISHYRDLADFIQPRLGRFFITDNNKGGKRHQNIINNTGYTSLRTAVAGLVAGTMSPAKPFFQLGVEDAEVMENHDAALWLEFAQKQILAVLQKSNFYNMVNPFLEEFLTFGTAAMVQEDDFEDVARFYTVPAGSYTVAQNDRNEVSVFAREFRMTVEQLVLKFGYENCSINAQNLWNNNNYDSYIQVLHMIYPNDDYDASAKIGPNSMAFNSDYLEHTQDGQNEEKLLRRGGFTRFPVYVPRWSLTGEDVYGTNCPGMVSLGDIKGLQVLEKRKAQAIDKMVNPPLTGPASLRSQNISSLPGGVTLYDGDPQANKLQPIYEVRMPIGEIRAEIDAHERRIKEAFHVPLFKAISDMEGIQPRNQLDLMHRHQERLLQLGPVLQQIHGEFLDRLIDRVFSRLVEAEVLPPPPEALQGRELEVSYISPLAIAQRAAGLEPLERFGNFVINMAQAFPEALDKFNTDQAVDQYAHAAGVSPRVLVPQERVDQIRAERQKQQQQAQAMEMAQQGAAVAKTAADAKTGDENLLMAMNEAQKQAGA